MSMSLNSESEPYSRGLGVYFMQKLQEHAEKVTQIDSTTGEQQSFQDVKRNSIKVALELLSRNIKTGDVVCLCSFNQMENLAVFLGSVFINAIFCAIDPGSSIDESIHLLKISRPKLLFCDDAGIKVIEKALEIAGIEAKVVSFNQTSNCENFMNFLKESSQENSFKPHIPSNSKDTAFIYFSSGSSGLPKGIELSYFAVLVRALVVGDTFHHPRLMNFVSFYWASTLEGIIESLTYGYTRVVYGMSLGKTPLDVIQDCQVNSTFMSPAILHSCIDDLKSRNYSLSCLKQITCGGGYIAEEKLNELRAFLPHTNIIRGYGMTETCGVVATFTRKNINKHLAKPNSSGQIMNGFKLKVVDLETGTLLGPNQKGEIHIASHTIMSGYYNNRQESDKEFDEEGYFSTGDVGYYDEDNYMYVVDRIKNLLKYRSYHVVPASLEMILMDHPDVALAVVVGVPHEIDGDHPMGIVTVRKGCKATSDEIVQFVNDRVPDRSRLRGGVKILDSIPVTPTGKPKRQLLKEMAKHGFN